jgi:putative tryptophan/tyrosine transport system substrate-binding protein
VKRREFIAGLGSAAAWPLAARGQQAAAPMIGFLLTGRRDAIGGASTLAAVHRGLAEMGYAEGRNLAVEYRWAENHLERLPELAADLVRLPLAAVIVTATATALAMKAATKSIPIVFSVGADPVKIGLVASLNRPDGNLTGIYNLNNEVAAKRLEALRQIVPTATSIAHLVNPANPAFGETETRELRDAARIFGVNLLVLHVTDPGELEPAFATAVRERADGVVVGGDSLFMDLRDAIITLAARHRVPVLYPWRQATAAGGLASYGTDFDDSFRQAGVYAARLVKGEKPADLPVQQVVKMLLVINMNTAKALGVTFPLTILGRADEVIE